LLGRLIDLGDVVSPAEPDVAQPSAPPVKGQEHEHDDREAEDCPYPPSASGEGG
jgi:hypothetical protein